TRAASMSSCAVDAKKPRITRMLNTDTALGRISVQYWSYPLSALATTRNVGTMPPLKNSVMTSVTRIVRCPNDRGRDSPYAHSTLTTIDTTVPTTVTLRLTN